MQVEEIWRFPVKSLAGERLDSVTVGERGLELDRMWGVLDVATGMTLTARREPSLLYLSATVESGHRPTIRTHDGNRLTDDDALSDHLGRSVRLHSAVDGVGTFENPVDVDRETDWVQWQSAGLTFHDGRSTVSLVSRPTLRDWDVRRFRMNLVVDRPGDDLLHGDVAIGGVVLRIRKPIARCVMVTRAQPGLERDRTVLHTIIRERSNTLGVGATVQTTGTISVGDRVEQR